MTADALCICALIPAARNSDRSGAAPSSRGGLLPAVAIQKLLKSLRLLDCFGLRRRNDGERSRLIMLGISKRMKKSRGKEKIRNELRRH